MKEEALALAAGISDPTRKLNVLREYLQALALRSLHESEAFLSLAFVGGTALRFAYGLPRFSEDIDFSLENQQGYKPEKWFSKIKRDLELAGFDALVSWSGKNVVHKTWIKVSGVLKESGLAAMSDQKLSIKVEIDTRPPAGAQCVRTLVTRHRVLALQHYDLPSLMAGKIHALCTRKYPKGRDWYDLLWYRGRRPPVEPNLVLLQNALDQTQGEGAISSVDWRARILDRARQIDDRTLQSDVKPFLEHAGEETMLVFNNFESVLA